MIRLPRLIRPPTRETLVIVSRGGGQSRIWVATSVWILACAGDDGGAADDSSTSAASGFATTVDASSTGVMGSTAADSLSGDSTATLATSTAASDSGETDGDLEGLLTLVYRAPHALDDVGAVGLAGGYRTTEVGWDGVDDLFSPVAYQLAFPVLPELDTASADGALGQFAWGSASNWVLAGNGMKLGLPDGPEVLACLIAFEATVANPDGYPVYVTNATQDDACAPSVDAFVPQTSYDLVLYGGDAFVDNNLPRRVTTPAALEVTSPDMSIAELAIDSTRDLAFEWIASDDDTSIEIRLIDADGTLLSAHANDDGAFAVAADSLQTLAPGPIDVLVARRKREDVAFTEGSVTVMMRAEQWGFFDLY